MDRAHEEALAYWFAHHHGVITLQEAGGLGISEQSLRRLACVGRIARRHRGVYVEKHGRGSPALTEAAAALAARGSAAALSHRSAAWLWGMLSQPPTIVDLVVPLAGHSKLRGVRIHRSGSPFSHRTVQGLRLTDPTRTLVDLADTVPGLLPRAVDQALAGGLVRMSDLGAATAIRNLDHAPGGGTSRPGTAVLRAHLRALGYLGAPSPSVLESRMARLFLRYGLPRPQAEVVAGQHGEYRIDFAYPQLRLAMEVDGYVWHASPERMAADLARRNRLQDLGWVVLVYTWRQVTQDPAGVAAEILAHHARLSRLGAPAEAPAKFVTVYATNTRPNDSSFG